MKKVLALIATTAVLSIGIAVPQAHASETGTYPGRKGVILVTQDSYYGSVPLTVIAGALLGHAAIVYSQTQVVESLSNGVVWGNNDWNKARKTVKGVTVKTTTAAQDAAAADWDKKQIGKPYNWNFWNMGDRSRFYCSQLVWAAFKDKYNIDLNTLIFDIPPFPAVAPTELLIKTSLIYKKGWI